MVINGEGGGVVVTPGRSERSSPTGAQVYLGEEENGTSTWNGEERKYGAWGRYIYQQGAESMMHLARSDKEEWLVLLTEWQHSADNGMV